MLDPFTNQYGQCGESITSPISQRKLDYICHIAKGETTTMLDVLLFLLIAISSLIGMTCLFTVVIYAYKWVKNRDNPQNIEPQRQVEVRSLNRTQRYNEL